MMKQQESILKWASCVLSQPVTSLKAVQDVSFVKRLLFRIDDVSFSEEWQLGGGAQSFSQVLQLVGKYFKQEIGTDISQHLQGVNVYRSPRDVWELLLGIAIKGNNRNNNISLIFEMDHSLQAELVKIVTDIIDKFGQNTAAIEEEPEEEPPSNDRQMMVELAQENEVLREECHRLETELLRQKQEKANGAALRKELQYNLQMMRLEKFAFFQVIANANRSNSKIFDDGDNVLETQSNLSELAQDIVQFIRQQRKTIQSESQRNAILQQQVNELRDNIRRCVQENQVYLSKLGDLNIYQKEIHALREQLTQKQQWNLELIQQVSTLQDEKANLLMSLQKKAVSFAPETQNFQKSELEEVRPYQAPQKKKALLRKGTLKGQDPLKSFNSSQGERQLGDSSFTPSEKQEAVKRQMEDELRQPQLRTKLQREVIFLKKTNASLQKQIEALKRTNQALQRSAKQFLDSNQQVIGKWEDDYESIIAKMTALTQVNENLQQENTNKDSENKKLAEKLKEKQREEEKARLAKQSNIFESDSIDSRSNSQMSQNQIEIVINPPPKTEISAQQKSKKDKAVLWDQIVLRLRQIVREGKTKELAYQSSLEALRNQNFKLLEIIRNKNESLSVAQPPALQKNMSEIEMKGDSSSHNYFLNIQRVQSQQVRDRQASRFAPARLSYLQIQEGQQLQQSAISRRGRMKSNYYGVNSRILNQITQRKPEPSFINDQSYLNFNRKLTTSIMENFKGMAGRIEHDPTASLQLQKKMQQQVDRISKQYSKLNSNYQNVFNKLHIYTETLKQKQSLKQGYEQVLQEISKAESEVKASHQAEIVKLRIQNQALKHQITENIIEKKDFMECITKLSASINTMKAEQVKKQQIAFKQMEKVLNQATNRFNSSIKDPLAFLDSCLQGQKQQGQLQKFYRLYIRQRERTKQLNEQIQLLSSVLLEYRNMVLS